jgi:hypothetical protein
MVEKYGLKSKVEGQKSEEDGQGSKVEGQKTLQTFKLSNFQTALLVVVVSV